MSRSTRRRVLAFIVAVSAALCAPSPSHARLSEAALEANPTTLTAVSFQSAQSPEAAPRPIFGPPTTLPDQSAQTSGDSASSESLPIGPVGGQGTADQSERSGKPASTLSSARLIYGLSIVVCLIFLTRWGVKKAASRVGTMAAQLGPAGRAPSGVLSVLARYPVGRGHSLVLLQMDQRVLLLNQTPDGFRMLTEVRTPEEVASLLIKTRDEQSESLSSRFSKLIKRFERDPSFVEYDIDTNFDGVAEQPAASVFPDTILSREESEADPLASIRRRLEQLQEASM